MELCQHNISAGQFQQLLKIKRLNVATFICLHLQGNSDQRQFTMQSGVLTGNDTGGAAQVAAAHSLNERTLNPQSAARQTPASCTMTFTLLCCPPMTHYVSLLLPRDVLLKFVLYVSTIICTQNVFSDADVNVWLVS